MSEYVISVQLQRKINAIKAADVKAKKAVFEIAYALAELADEQNFMLSDAGYKDIVEFAADQFGYARSTTLNYVKIANRYLTSNKQEVRTICADLDDGGKATADYKVGQLNALPGNVDRDEFKRLDTAGIINKEMSADKIKQTLKDYYNPPSDPEPKPKPKPEPDTDSTEQGEPEQEHEQEHEQEQEQEQEQIPCLTLSVFQIFLNIVTPVIDDFYELSDPETDIAVQIFKQFFGSLGYQIHWIADDDDEIIGAELLDGCGEKLYSTNQEV